MKTRSIILIASLALLFACKPVVDDFTPERGSADFSSFVAVGNSLTAGYADAALYTSGQEFSYANILAQQLKSVGNNGTFKTPLMPTEDGVRVNATHVGLYFTTKLVVGYSNDCLGTTSLGPVPAVADPDQQKLQQELFTSVASEGPFNNTAVPGIKITHLFAPGLGTLNPYYGRFATNPQTDRLIDEPAKVNPTFFLFWVGSNDVLDYATSGGIAPITPVDGQVGVGFRSSYQAAIQTMLSLTDKGVVANVPDVTAIPFFKTVPYNPIVLQNQEDVDALNNGYALYNQLMEANGLPFRINFALGQNPMVIYDADLPFPPQFEQYKFRQITEGELVLLTIPQDSIKCAGWGTQKPVPNQYVLTKTELGRIEAATNAYNGIIRQVVNDYGLALGDAYNIIRDIDKNGYIVDGVTFTSSLITGNTYSTDGIHLSAQGNAMVANAFIDAINDRYSANIPTVNIVDYPPIVLP